MTELERDFTFYLTKYPSLIFVFLVVSREIGVHVTFNSTPVRSLPWKRKHSRMPSLPYQGWYRAGGRCSCTLHIHAAAVRIYNAVMCICYVEMYCCSAACDCSAAVRIYSAAIHVFSVVLHFRTAAMHFSIEWARNKLCGTQKKSWNKRKKITSLSNLNQFVTTLW